MKVAIFDFDGTLADTESIIRDIYSEVAAEKGWPALTHADYERLRRGTIQEAISWVGVRPWQLPGLLRQGRKRFHKRVEEAGLFKGIDKVINDLHDDGWHIYVLSANTPHAIHVVMSKYKLDNKVKVLKRSPLFSKHKAVGKLLKKNGYNRDNTWMIGDEVRDIEAAHKAGVRSVAVTWGLQAESALKDRKPTFVAKRPQDITKFLKENL